MRPPSSHDACKRRHLAACKHRLAQQQVALHDHPYCVQLKAGIEQPFLGLFNTLQVSADTVEGSRSVLMQRGFIPLEGACHGLGPRAGTFPTWQHLKHVLCDPGPGRHVTGWGQVRRSPRMIPLMLLACLHPQKQRRFEGSGMATVDGHHYVIFDSLRCGAGACPATCCNTWRTPSLTLALTGSVGRNGYMHAHRLSPWVACRHGSGTACRHASLKPCLCWPNTATSA